VAIIAATDKQVSKSDMEVNYPSSEEVTTRNRFLGCLLAGAAGDALGAPVEFDSLALIQEKFGPRGIRDFVPAYGKVGAITDDTQMTLFTAEAMIRTHMRMCDRGIASVEAVTAHAYQRWLLTQGVRGSDEFRFFLEKFPGWLIGVKALHKRRAPGNTCLSALKATQSFDSRARNDSKGCGAVMRAAPVGLAGWRFGMSADEVFRTSAEIGRLTHGHPSGYLSAGALAVVIAQIVGGASVLEATEAALRELVTWRGHEETLQALERAISLAGPGRAEIVPSELGEGWVGEEALAIAVYCALTAASLEEGIVMAVNIDGDSDSTGSIAGNILGALHGVEAIPERWLEVLELREVVERIASDLHDCTIWITDASDTEAEESRVRRKFQDYPPN